MFFTSAGRACLSPTNSSVPVLYVFGKGTVDVRHLAEALLSGPLKAASAGNESAEADFPDQDDAVVDQENIGFLKAAKKIHTAETDQAPVLLLYDVTYAHAVPALLETLSAEGFQRDDGNGRVRLVVGLPTNEEYSPMVSGTMIASTINSVIGSDRGDKTSGGDKTISSEGTDIAAAMPGCGCNTISATRSCDSPSTISCGIDAQGYGVEGGTNSAAKSCCGRARGSSTHAFGATEALPCRDIGGEGRALAGREERDRSGYKSQGQNHEQPREYAAAVDSTTSDATQKRNDAGSLRPEAVATATGATVEKGTVASMSSSSPAEQGNNSTVANGKNTSSTAGRKQQDADQGFIRIGGLGVEIGSEEALKNHILFFVGREGRQLSNVLLRCAGCRDRLRYDPSLPPDERLIADTGTGNRDLMRRYSCEVRCSVLERSSRGILEGNHLIVF